MDLRDLPLVIIILDEDEKCQDSRHNGQDGGEEEEKYSLHNEGR